RGLLRALAGLDAGHEVVLFAPPELRALLPSGAGFDLRPTQVPVYDLREHTRLRRELLRAGCDVYHVPHYNVPWRFPAPLVVTIHDLVHLRYPEFLRSRAHAAYARGLLAHAVRRARTVIAVSEATRRELEAQLHLEPA